ncbi:MULTISPECIES: ParA family protein [unclassified Thioalkalivibrio]|uniref:ParA family protein n=1 Tax=unclassified Thioalkalivibrio TaxID=2621013 RepID=UPI000361CF39|nr:MULTISPECIES: ParA family protein [unclassified Thioalkalivibrio]
MRTIAVINQKGGVGKTTVTLNLSHALALAGYRVLAIDADPQGHLSMAFGLEDPAGLDRVLHGGARLADAFSEAGNGLQIVAAGAQLQEVENLNAGGAQRGWRLKRALDDLPEPFDFVLIDCPPSAGLLGVNAIIAADEMLIPVAGDFLALNGLSRLMRILQGIEQRLGRARTKWIVLSRFVEQRRHAREVRERIREHFAAALLPTTIRETVVLAESPSFGQTIFEYQPRHRAARDFQQLAADLVAAGAQPTTRPPAAHA